jgi:hypothetical protein
MCILMFNPCVICIRYKNRNKVITKEREEKKKTKGDQCVYHYHHILDKS